MYIKFCFTWSFYSLLGVTNLCNFVRLWIVLSNFSDTFVIVRCLIVVSQLQQEVHWKKNIYINEGTIKYFSPIKSVWKTDETFVLIFGTLSLLNSYFYGMRNPFHSLSSEIVKNRPFALRGHVMSFLWKWKLYDFAFEKRLVGHILNKIIVIWFFKSAPFS